jgi:hypothetical protein
VADDYLDLALEHAENGWHVFAAQGLGDPEPKHPYPGTHAYKDATRDPDRIEAMWAAHPSAVPAVVPGWSDLTCVDIDGKPGQRGFESAWELAFDYEAAAGVHVSKSMSGKGVHVYTRGATADSVPASGIEVKSLGGYAVELHSLPPVDSITMPTPEWAKAKARDAARDLGTTVEAFWSAATEPDGPYDGALGGLVHAVGAKWSNDEVNRRIARLIGFVKTGEPGGRTALDDMRHTWLTHRTHSADAATHSAEFDSMFVRGVEKFGKAVDTAPAQPEFWRSRAFLTAVHDRARAKLISPWALLGAVLAHAAAHVPPSVVLPGSVGGAPASLNLFVGVVGKPGMAKSTAFRAASTFLRVAAGCSVLETGIGSGEGLASAFGRMPRPTQNNPTPEFIQTRESVHYAVDEVRSLEALLDRKGATLGPVLNSAWTADPLGNENATHERTRRLKAGAYRLVVSLGIQPEHADALLDQASNGLPQRLLWFDAYDPDLGGELIGAPVEAWDWELPVAARGGVSAGGVLGFSLADVPKREALVLSVCDEALAEVRNARLSNNRPMTDDSDADDSLSGHALLARLKVAAILALIDGCTEVRVDDWMLAAIVSAHSDATLAQVRSVLARSIAKKSAQAGAAQGKRAAAAEMSKADEMERTTRDWARTWFDRRRGEDLPLGEVRKAASTARRDYVEAALAELVDMGDLVATERQARNNGTATYYRRA